MNRERLERVIEAVRNQPEERFDMRWWKRVNCSTTCCAIGSYIDQNPLCGIVLIPDRLHSGTMTVADPEDIDTWSMEVIADHFDIHECEAEFLFDPQEYGDTPIPKSAVIARIEAFIAEHEAAGMGKA